MLKPIAIAGIVLGALLGAPLVGLTQEAPSSHVVPLKKFSVGALNKRIEAVRGDRTTPGEPFVIRIHAEAGFVIMPHTHPVDENIVILTGTWALGMGERFKKDALEPMEPGDYGFASHNMAHFAFSKTDTIIQVHGIGPFFVKWVTPMYELTDHGALLKTTAEDAGQPASNVPADCFVLKVGTPVHGSYGDGTIIGAQCTPGELTQYRVEKKNGEHFWGQRDELKALDH